MNNKDIKSKTNEEIQNKRLMFAMWALLIISSIFYIGILTLAVNTLKEGVLLGVIICFSTILFLISGFISLKLEVSIGYYECRKCHHRFVPTYIEALIAPHFGTTRYLKCPKCNKKKLCKKSYE